MNHANNLGSSKRRSQINKSQTAKLNGILKPKLGSGDFIENIQPYEKPLIHVPEMTAEVTPEQLAAEVDEAAQTICERCLPYLYSIRKPVADYQEKNGIAKDEQYTFCSLVMAIGTNMYNSLMAMGAMLGNLLPIFDAVLLIARFIIDKLIDIMEADEENRMTKAALFFVEAIPIFFIIGFIYGFILLPLYALFIVVFGKLWDIVL